MTKGFLQPQQQRSRETLARLITATLTTLEEHGLEGATIARIAGVAKIAPASVYRRFRDRDALYRVALLHVLERAADQDVVNEHSGGQTLEAHVHRIVSLTLQQFTLQPGLMRALTRFVESDSDEEFRTRALRSISISYERLTDGLLAYRERIVNPDPRKAITFALLTMGTVIEVRALEQVSMWNELTQLSDEDFVTEVSRSFLGYLGYSGSDVVER
ncbi:TetR/AcrR family transcriptional regulator [Granulicella tundricola]|uniref:Regulatory protein TetR n=1 Tax=Granulicella tundricola (strain ATCC BAA-1859 / DSM 23138 / MP5ACTX9) TaxID=1198114 RepID=E8WXF8_GRATM|nr:TetR/AcrR family transcriptional regulator [Granulicella tundricola]ADW67491.1 regulatory protein TetR [Granulicella tundricola MP5ACTX9]